jgi:hypothetical protein
MHEKHEKDSYAPLFAIIGVIFLASAAISYVNGLSLRIFIEAFMTGFFLAFATFKLTDLKGFAMAYSEYDLLAKNWYGYGLIYPFIELLFGLSMIIAPQNRILLSAELVLMLFSGLGVFIKLSKHEKFHCACLGTFLKVPLTKVTLMEDFGMAFLAFLLLII